MGEWLSPFATRDEGAARDSRANRTSRAESSRSASHPSRGFHAMRPGTVDDDARSNRAAERDRKKRQRTKARADKMFDRQMAQSASAAASDQAEGAPRAAIYETKMGASHRRSARLQNAAQAGPVSAKINPAGWFSNFHVRPRVAGIVTAVVCVLLIGVFLYAPARDYYQAQRQHDRLSTEYTQLEQRNAALTEQNQTLASDAGMEDAVRQKYGYVVEGEDSAVVTGLSDQTIESIRSAAEVEPNVLSSSIKPTEEWYTPYLDAFFGVN